MIERLPNVILKTGLSKSSIYAKVKTGDFPKPIKLGARATGWLASDIQMWIKQKINESKNVA